VRIVLQELPADRRCRREAVQAILRVRRIVGFDGAQAKQRAGQIVERAAIGRVALPRPRSGACPFMSNIDNIRHDV